MVCHRTDLGTASAEGPSNEGRVKGVREASVSAASGPSGQNSEGKEGKRRQRKTAGAYPSGKTGKALPSKWTGSKKGTAQPEGITNGGSDRSGCVSQALCLKRVAIRDKKVDRASVCRSDKEKRAETGPISVRFSGNQNRAIRIRCSKILLLSLARRWQTQRWCAP